MPGYKLLSLLTYLAMSIFTLFLHITCRHYVVRPFTTPLWFFISVYGLLRRRVQEWLHHPHFLLHPVLYWLIVKHYHDKLTFHNEEYVSHFTKYAAL